jgi:putative flippase GtrA
MNKKRKTTQSQQKSLKERLFNPVQIAQYLISGGAWFWSGYFIIVFLTPVIGLWWANLLGNGVGITLNFLLERYWVFTGSKNRKVTEVSAKYVIYTAINFVLNYFVLRGLQKIGIPVAIGQFIAAALFTVWNYVWYKLWVFKGTPQTRRSRPHA